MLIMLNFKHLSMTNQKYLEVKYMSREEKKFVKGVQNKAASVWEVHFKGKWGVCVSCVCCTHMNGPEQLDYSWSPWLNSAQIYVREYFSRQSKKH